MNFVGGTGDEWWQLAKKFDDALARVSDRFRDQHGRSLSLGSPVLIGERSSDMVRVPIILRGGPRELPVAYLMVEMLKADKSRINEIAAKAGELALNVLANPSAATPQEPVLKYG